MSVSVNHDSEKRVTADVPEVKPTARETAWLKARLERGKRERFTEVVTITPGLAGLMLKHNLGNRKIHRSQIQRHMDRLQRGDFRLTHQGMAFAKTGVMNDGQHRLLAIVESGIAGVIQVTFGAEREEFLILDQQKTRGAADMLGILNQDYSALRASVAKYLLIVRNAAMYHPDPQLVTDYAMELRSPTFDEAMRYGMAMKALTSPTSAAVAYYWIAKRTTKPTTARDEFWDGMVSGEGLTGVKLNLREWLRKATWEGSNATTITCQRAGAIITAYNSFVSKRRTFDQKWRHAIKLPDVL